MALGNPTDGSPSGSFVQGILQARILEWVAISSPGDLPIPGIKPRSPMSHALAGGFFTVEPPGKPLVLIKQSKNPFAPTGMFHQYPQKQPKSHFLSTDYSIRCTRIFLHFSEKGRSLPRCAHHPFILYSGPHPTEQSSQGSLDTDHMSSQTWPRQGQAEWRSQPHREEERNTVWGFSEVLGAWRAGPGASHLGSHSWPWGTGGTVSRCLTPLCVRFLSPTAQRY